MTDTNHEGERIAARSHFQLSRKTRLAIARLAALLFVIALSVFIFSIRDKAKELAVYGYPGIFLISLLAYATVLLPAPGTAIVFTMGGVFNPLGVALAAGLGAAVGELTGYLAGFSGQAVIERTDLYERLERSIRKYGPAAILVLSAIPNPLFDVAGLVAGALRIPVLTFFLCCWAGETIKMIFFAYAGVTLLQWLP